MHHDLKLEEYGYIAVNTSYLYLKVGAWGANSIFIVALYQFINLNARL